MDCLHPQDCMDQVVLVFSLAVQGLRTNFWGLGCPSYCGSFPASFFLPTFVLGWIIGVISGFVIFHHLPLFFLSSPSPVASAAVSQRLSGYLHDTTFHLRDLVITVSGPASQASQFVADCSTRRSCSASSRGLPSSSPPFVASEETVHGGETRAEIEASFRACPQHCLDLASRLSGSIEFSRKRIHRAWRAGQWAGAVLQGRVGSPNRSEQLPLQPRVRVVLRSSSSQAPACFRSSSSYWAYLGGTHGTSISHSFPSETEARIYCQGADIEFPEVQP